MRNVASLTTEQIEESVAILEARLSREKAPVIRQAIANEIARLRGQTRKKATVRTADGAWVTVGATVYGFTAPHRPYRTEKDVPPVITSYTVVAIRSSGMAVLQPSYCGAFLDEERGNARRWSTPRKAYEAMLADMAEHMKGAKSDAVNARRFVADEEKRLAVVKRWKIVVTPYGKSA